MYITIVYYTNIIIVYYYFISLLYIIIVYYNCIVLLYIIFIVYFISVRMKMLNRSCYFSIKSYKWYSVDRICLSSMLSVVLTIFSAVKRKAKWAGWRSCRENVELGLNGRGVGSCREKAELGLNGRAVRSYREYHWEPC